ncbi:hypothetical protein [Amycolatopsis methanolica]|uniref:hypothetical protein n=1 Tax=Amycolatopsis methanolica TaxID=1814 RepID=UPI00343326B4
MSRTSAAVLAAITASSVALHSASQITSAGEKYAVCNQVASRPPNRPPARSASATSATIGITRGHSPRTTRHRVARAAHRRARSALRIPMPTVSSASAARTRSTSSRVEDGAGGY